MTYSAATGDDWRSPMSHTFNFFEREALAAPEFTAAQAEIVVRERYGIDGAATALGSQQDANFRIVAPEGVFVLKVSNPVFTASDLDAQDRAAAHVARCCGIRVPAPVPGIDGRPIQPVTPAGWSTLARLLTYIEGDTLSTSRYLAPPTMAALGDLAGRTAQA